MTDDYPSVVFLADDCPEKTKLLLSQFHSQAGSIPCRVISTGGPFLEVEVSLPSGARGILHIPTQHILLVAANALETRIGFAEKAQQP